MAGPATVAYEIPGFSRTSWSGADFTGEAAGQHRFVVHDAAGKAVNPAAGGRVTGVRCNKPNVDQAMTVRTTGIVMVEASAAIVFNAAIATTVDGRAVTATTGNQIVGRCIVPASAAGALCSVELNTDSPVSA